MSVLLSIFIGILAGFAAGKTMKGRGFGMIVNLIVGLIGGLIGGWIFSRLGVDTYGILGTLLSSTIGAIILLFILSFFSFLLNPAE